MSKLNRTLLHDGGHALIAAAVTLALLQYTPVPLFPAFLLGTLGMAIIFEVVIQGWLMEARLFGDWDKWRDLATYQAPWVLYFPLAGNWDGAWAFIIAYAPAMIAFYHRYYQESEEEDDEEEPPEVETP